MKVDFRKLKVQLNFEGDPAELDVSKQLGNLINSSTADFAVSDYAREIYYKGEVAIQFNEAIAEIVKNSAFLVPVKRAIMEQFKTE